MVVRHQAPSGLAMIIPITLSRPGSPAQLMAAVLPTRACPDGKRSGVRKSAPPKGPKVPASPITKCALTHSAGGRDEALLPRR
jgi:hypothetical protein